MRPGCRHGLRTPARKANKIGYRTQTTGPENQKRRPGCRHGLRTPARKANKFGFRTQTRGRVKQKKRRANEEACIVKQLLTMQASSISIVYCSPCELSSV